MDVWLEFIIVIKLKYGNDYEKYSIIICTLLVLAGCSDWLSEDGAPKIDYSLYETEAGIDAALVSAYNYLRLGASGEHASAYVELGTDLFTEGSDGSWRDSFDQYGQKWGLTIHCFTNYGRITIKELEIVILR